MRIASSLYVATIALLAALTTAPAAAATVPPGFIDRVLPNGLQVTILPEPGNPLVATRIWYHVGAANEAADTRGFAHLFEHLMFSGTPTHPKGEYEAHIHRFGGYDNAYTSWDETTYESDVPPEGFAGLLAMEADRMVNLHLDQQDLDNEKRIVTEELRVSVENDPVSRVARAALKELLGKHPYAVTPLGTKEDIAAATLPRARDFYARYYGPRNAHLVIVGPVDGPATLARVERLFGALPATGETPPDVAAVDQWSYPARIAFKEDIPPVKLALLTYPLPPPTSDDGDALDVLGELLGGGQTDPFAEDLVRRRRQALEAGSRRLMLRRGGVFCFYSAALPHRSESGQYREMEKTLRELGSLKWLTDEALAGARQRVRRRVENEGYFSGRMADALGRARWWRGDARIAFERSDRIARVSRDDVARVFRRYIGQAQSTRVYVQPEHVPLWLRLVSWILPVFM